jgi:diguanylate cyclase (GGDEF)-like protein
MADTKKGRARRALSDWAYHFRLLRPARSVVWIFAVAIIFIAVIWSAVIVRIQTERQETRDAAVAASAQLASAFAQHISKTVHDADAVVSWVKYEYERSPSTFDLGKYQRQGLISADTALQVTLIGAYGEVMQTTTSNAKQVNLSDRPHFLIHQANADAGLYISQPVVGRVSKQSTLQFTRRLNHPDGSFAGVVVVSEDPAYLTDGFYNRDALGGNGMIAVLSDNGYLLSRRVGDEAGSPEGPPASAYSKFARIQRETLADPVDNVHRIVTYRHLAQEHVAVVVGLSERDVFAAYRHAKALYFLMAGLISAMLLVAAGAVAVVIRRLRYVAETDSLTGLPNRHLLTLALRRRMSALGATGRLAMIYIDLDNFKKINDSLGHKAGDDLLKKVASRLAEVPGKNRLLARMGGDEFVILVEHVDAAATARDVAEATIQTFDRVFGIHGNSYLIRVSIGIAVYTDHKNTEFDLLTEADLAMYSAKAGGKPANVSRYCFYTPVLAERARREAERLQELQYAIINREFFVEYQPVVSLDTGDMIGVEALVRWRHPEKGVILPGEFLPVAEASGLIVPIGEFVLEQACEDFRAWQEEDPRPLTLSVNVSAVQLATGDLVHAVKRCLNDYMIEPDRLQLEVTETAILDRSALVSARLNELRDAGVKIVLDDFGRGYSSLSHLLDLAIDGVKVDRDFTRRVPDDRSAAAMLASLIGLTRELGLSLVVEGVELHRQVDWLRQFGNLAVQGFYFYESLPAANLPIGKVA